MKHYMNLSICGITAQAGGCANICGIIVWYIDVTLRSVATIAREFRPELILEGDTLRTSRFFSPAIHPYSTCCWTLLRSVITEGQQQKDLCNGSSLRMLVYNRSWPRVYLRVPFNYHG